jgi:hypothetical protein
MHFCGFFAYMSCLLYFTEYVASALYRGSSDAADGTPERALYDEGVRVGSLGLAFYAFVSCVHATLVPALIARFGVRLVYAAPYFAFAAAFAVMTLAGELPVAFAACAFCGTLFATIYTVPYIILGRLAMMLLCCCFSLTLCTLCGLLLRAAGFVKLGAAAADEETHLLKAVNGQSSSNSNGDSNGSSSGHSDSAASEETAQFTSTADAGFNLAVVNTMQVIA